MYTGPKKSGWFECFACFSVCGPIDKKRPTANAKVQRAGTCKRVRTMLNIANAAQGCRLGGVTITKVTKRA